MRLALEDEGRIPSFLREAAARLEAEQRELSLRRGPARTSPRRRSTSHARRISDLDVTLVDVPEQHVLRFRMTARLEEFSRIIPGHLQRIFALAPDAGPPYFICFEEPTDAVPVEIGVVLPEPSRRPATASRPAPLAAVRAARAIYRGPYEEIMEAYSVV